MTYLLALSVIGTYGFIIHVQPYLELWFQKNKAELMMELEQKELKLNEKKFELMRKYPEMYNESADNVVGFHYEEPRDEYCDNADYDGDEFDDFEEVENDEDDSMYKIEVRKDNTIGYKYDGEIK